ncbi:hypothetical protein GGI43DRAFT_387003 [Trichoderma evansii]
MPRYNPQSLHFGANTAAVEATIRARLTKPDSVIFLWPPGATRSDRHISWVMLGFGRRPDVQVALEDLKNLELLGRPVKVERASRQAFLPRPSPSPSREAARTATTTAAASAPTPAPATAAPATITADLPVRIAPAHDMATCSSSNPLEETSLTSQEV